MTKLTATEGLILAELLLKLAHGDEKLADEIVDVIYNMVATRTIEASTPETRMREQENIVTGTVDICGW